MPTLTTAVAGAVRSAVDIDRDAAREAAVRELSDPRYAADDPTLLQRISRRVFSELSEILSDAAGFVPGGAWGLVLALGILAVIAAIVVTVGRRVLREQRAASAGRPLFDTQRPLTAADHRLAAERAEAAQQWDVALQERLRAIVRGLEERGLLSARPGRTADEAAAEAAALSPGSGVALNGLATRFDAVRYGGGHATESDARDAQALDRAMAQVRLTVRNGRTMEQVR
jgi:Domain of unknown function (DUF4129)